MKPAAKVPTAMTEISRDAVVEANRRLLLARSDVGIDKYGVTLEKAKLSQRVLLQHILEELLDGANYIQAEIMRLDAEEADVKLKEDLDQILDPNS